MIITVLLAAQAAGPQMPAFLAGCWEHGDGARWTQECWTDPRAGQMMGSSRTGDDARIREWEWLRIERGGDGAIAYIASPQGRPATLFRAVSGDDHSIVFANPAHDYPQRIRYTLSGDTLEAEISSLDGSKPRRWTYRRSGGPAPASQPTISSGEKK